MKRLIQILFLVGSILAVKDIFFSPQLLSFGLARFCAEAILITLSVVFAWRQIYLGWREKRRWWNEHAKIDLRILRRDYGVFRQKIVSFENSASEAKLRRKKPDAFSSDGKAIRLARPDEISLLLKQHADLIASDERIVQDMLRRNIAAHAKPAEAPESFRQEQEKLRLARQVVEQEQARHRDEQRWLDPEGTERRERLELMRQETVGRLRELRISAHVRSRGRGLPVGASTELQDSAEAVAAEQLEVEELTSLLTQVKEELKAMQLASL